MRVVAKELSIDSAAEALGGEVPLVLYCDPPWGPGLLAMFRTMNGQPEHETDWPGFLSLLADVAHFSRATHVFIEMGPRWIDELAATMERAGFREAARWRMLYGQRKKPLPCFLWYSGPGAPCDPIDMFGEPATRHVIDSVAVPGALVFDPCCGKGMTARCAVRAGMRFAGVELNPKRAQVTIDWLEKHDRHRAHSS
jgi:hypothetical protein